MLNYGLNLTLKLILFSLIHLLGLRVWCLSLGFVQLTDHDVVTCNHNNLSSVKVTRNIPNSKGRLRSLAFLISVTRVSQRGTVIC